MPALLFLLAAALLGIGAVRRALGATLDGLETMATGLVAGWMAATWIAFAAASARGRLAAGDLLLVTLLLGLGALLALRPELARMREWRRSFRWRREWTPVALLLAVAAPVFTSLFMSHMLEPRGGRLWSGGSTWGDVCMHLAFTNSFLHGDNFPPVYPLLPPEPFRYPFLADFQVAALMALGLGHWGALVVTGVALCLTLTVLLHALARRLTGSSAAGTVAALLFLLNGGLGFLQLLPDWKRSGRTLSEFWQNLPHNYAHIENEGLHWSNVITDGLLPQRTLLFGLAAGFAVLVLFAAVWASVSRETGGASLAARCALLAAGCLTALLPRFHTHAFLALGLLSLFLFLLRPRRAWGWFWLPAVIAGGLQLGGVIGHVASRRFLSLAPGWMAPKDPYPALFWLRNFGLPLLLIVPAWTQTRPPWRRFYLAFVLLFVFAASIALSPHVYDNVKLMLFTYAATSALIAGWLVRLARDHRQPFLATLLFLGSIASGLLAVHRERLLHWQVFDRADLELAAFVREHTEPRARFASFADHRQPVSTLAGRRLVMGYPGWLWTHGYDYRRRESDLRDLFRGGRFAPALIRHYKIDYVYLGPGERDKLHANEAYFQATFPLLYRGERAAIYDVRSVR